MYEIALGVSALCFLGVCAYFWKSPAYSVFHPLTFYLAFHGVVFVFRPILAWTRGYDSIYRTYQFMPSMSDKITVIYATTAGLLTFAFFCLRFGGGPVRFSDDPSQVEERRRLTQIFLITFAICAPPAAYSLLSSYGSDNNFVGLTLDRATGVAINTVRNGYFTDLQNMAPPLAAVLIWLARYRWWSFIPLIGFIVMRAGTGGRGPFVTALVSVALFYLYDKRIRYPKLPIVAATVLLLAAFTAVGSDRGAAVRQAVGLEEQDAFETRQSQSRFMEGMDFGNLEYMEYLVYVVPQRSGTYDYFLDNLQLFTEPIPRVLFPQKPVGEPLRRIWLFEHGFPIGMTRSVPGEGWYALGWIGVVIWCALWGAALGRLYTWFAKGGQSNFKIAAYLVFLPIMVIAYRDGLLLTVVRQAGAFLAPIYLWYLLSRWFGVPTAAQIRAAWARRSAAGSPGGGRPGAAAVPAQPLPPAVARRRLALAVQDAPKGEAQA